MPTAKTRRGRPIGSGINDTERLTEIAARIAAKPGLKPTTAIRAMGISDPSSIRRLRDKFKKFVSDQKSSEPVQRKTRSTDTHIGQKIHQQAELQAAAPLAKPSDPRKFQKPAPIQRSDNDVQLAETGQTNSQPAIGAPSPCNNDWVASWCSSNLSAMADAMGAQMAVTHSMLCVPYYAMAVRQQLALNALALSVLPHGQKRRTLH